jgi:hypothetical protein
MKAPSVILLGAALAISAASAQAGILYDTWGGTVSPGDYELSIARDAAMSMFNYSSGIPLNSGPSDPLVGSGSQDLSGPTSLVNGSAGNDTLQYSSVDPNSPGELDPQLQQACNSGTLPSENCGSLENGLFGGQTISIAAVPEPGSLILAGVAVFLLSTLRRPFAGALSRARSKR